ncbi:flagellar hook assembly protein FlgD [Pseudomonas sp. G11-1]|uniref:Basal-body rod modification protein FlgD n=1 Tax=Halopseudomonas bauzanensis TaxID=653930 RepID=A0A4U0YRA0_9GAMM|nr:flagellar hook assembly protein FlgD [Halopseudomonas bauzanensis]EZQ18462.1 flagellar basal body rod modification protein FlgD [Halopseudomonas bauzanensis]MCO5786356.1 flagellar hook assembly protein FlgD [Pseudomonas sp. G11-1]MCO5789582.1 flagellar hook assembly protein FlgD [Pseudomonas sp. G11-2]TKA92464.1 flagellar hook assembly protein FlgD [Halopseudomonas bauzanensis]
MSNISIGNSLLDQYKVDQNRFAKGDELGKNEFLELLVAQLNNQDPLAPQENGEFIAQLAQFSTVEGIEKMNSTMEAMASSFQSSQALQASSLVGRTVVVPTDKAMVDPEAGFTGQLALPQASGAVRVNVYDEAGSVVSTINLGAQEGGIHEFTWDGTDASGNVLPAGKYRFEAQASVNGETVQLATLLPANVDSVSLGVGHGGEMVLNLAGLGSIGLSEVFSIGK